MRKRLGESGKRCVRSKSDGGISGTKRSGEGTTDEEGVSMHTCRKTSFLLLDTANPHSRYKMLTRTNNFVKEASNRRDITPLEEQNKWGGKGRDRVRERERETHETTRLTMTRKGEKEGILVKNTSLELHVTISCSYIPICLVFRKIVASSEEAQYPKPFHSLSHPDKLLCRRSYALSAPSFTFTQALFIFTTTNDKQATMARQ